VVSALDDDLKTIKTYHHAALKQGLSQQTRVTALADGANCWSVISVLEPHCQTIEPILDWFHIAKKFQNVKNALGEAFANPLRRKVDSMAWRSRRDSQKNRINPR